MINKEFRVIKLRQKILNKIFRLKIIIQIQKNVNLYRKIKKFRVNLNK